MVGDPAEVPIGRQQRQIMSDAELGDESVNRSDLNSLPPTSVAQGSGLDVIREVRSQERQGREPGNDLRSRPGAGETLEEFLQHDPRGENELSPLKRMNQRLHLGEVGRAFPSEGERPHARVDEELHDRDRSDL